MRLSFLTKFSLLSLVIIVVLGLFLGGGIARYQEKSAIQHEIVDTSSLAHILIDHHFTPEDFAKGLTPRKYQEIDQFVRENVLNDHLILVKIWNLEGKVIYSSNKKLVNRKFPLSEGLKKAFRGKVAAEISSLKKKEHVEEKRKFSRLIEIYTPIISPRSQKAIGSYEVYLFPTSLWQHIAETQRFLWLGLLGGFLILYLSIFGIARNVSRALVEKEELEELNVRLNRSLSELEETYIGTIKTLSAAVDAKDHYTAGHSLRVSYFASALGRLAGLPENDLKRLEQAALFHDIGKIGTPEYILNKEGKLKPEEFEEIKKHSPRGAEIIQTIPFLQDTAPIIRYHHENFDGTGYPDGLKGDEIPLEARILKIADIYDALISNRPYRRAKTPEEAVAILKENKGSQFDPDLVDLFTEWLRENRFVIPEETKSEKIGLIH